MMMNFLLLNRKIMLLILFLIISFTIYYMCEDNDYILDNDNIDFDDNNNNVTFSNTVPRIIWLYWDGRMDEEVKYMLHYLKENMDNYSIIFLSSNAMCNYLNTTLYPHRLHTLPKANQADYYRFNLLYKYGGIWLDSSTYMKDATFLDGIINKLEGNEGDVGNVKDKSNNTEDKDNEANNKRIFFAFNSFFPMPYHIEIGFMISFPHTEFIKKILDEMEICLKIGRLNYMKKRINEGIVIYSDTVYDNTIPFAPHYNIFYCFYVCMQTVVQKYYDHNPPILLYRSEEYIYKLHTHCGWDPECMVKGFITDINNEVYPITIFTSASRNKMRFPKIDII